MMIDVNFGTLINDAIVSCSQGTESHQQAVLHVHDGNHEMIYTLFAK